EYQRVNALSAEEATRNSPLKAGMIKDGTLPQTQFQTTSSSGMVPDDTIVSGIIKALDQDRWLVKHIQISRPYSVLPDGSEMNTAKLSDENGKGIVDSSEQQYISTREYEKNMGLLIRYLKK
ncbi:MAG: hypothetical protein B7X75_05870, partial [Sphingobacteriales bacterium 39-40-5]